MSLKMVGMTAFAVAAIAACASTQVAGPGTSRGAGESLYREHCGACHRLRDPSEQTRERWAWAVEHYGPRAHLSPEERQLVLGYLQAHAKDAPADGSAR